MLYRYSVVFSTGRKCLRQDSVVGAQETEMVPEQLAQVFATAVAQALLRQHQQQQQQRPREAIAELKVGLKDLSGRQEGWEDWKIEHQEKGKAMGFVDELTTHEGHDIMVGAERFDASGVDLVRLRQARQTWTSLITTCKGTARDLVKSAESPDGAWRLLNQHYRASGLKEKRRLAEEFNFMKMKIEEPPKVHHEGRQCSKGTAEVGKDYR